MFIAIVASASTMFSTTYHVATTNTTSLNNHVQTQKHWCKFGSLLRSDLDITRHVRTGIYSNAMQFPSHACALRVDYNKVLQCFCTFQEIVKLLSMHV